MQRIIVSPRGHADLRTRLERKMQEYGALREERRRAFELSGDGWHDNPYLNNLQQMEAELTRQITELQQQVARARVLDICDGRRPMEVVRYGSIVSVQVEGASEPAIWEIVGFDESDASRGLLAYSAPLGQVLIGREEGEVVECDGKSIEVLALHASWGEARRLRGGGRVGEAMEHE